MSKLYSPEYLAYCAEQGVEPDSQVVQLFFSQGCRAAPDSFSPPAQKTVSELGGSGAGLVGNSIYHCVHCGAPSLVDPLDDSPARDYCSESECGSHYFGGAYVAPVLDGSGAGLVGNPSQILDFCDTLPATMTGDAWESAARHVLAMRSQAS